MVTVLNIEDLVSGIKRAAHDLSCLMNPFRWDDFFRDMRLEEPKITPMALWALLSLLGVMVLPWILVGNDVALNLVILVILIFTLWLGNYLMDFLLIAGYFTYLGYFVAGVYGTMDNLTAIKVGFQYFFVGVFLVFLMSYLLMVFSRWELDFGESFPLTTYSIIPGLLGGIFAAYGETIVLSFLFIAYSTVLLYVGIKIRVGFEKSFTVLVMAVFTGGAVSMILLVFLSFLLGTPEWAF
ncbi:MAG: hypothetical protein B6U72_01990 [Candidatus Altiarchaeales archaeon ex4484_2]|nr:MAG: hypothetical protein B6U72_01990 [Candidatus Altiarchaeales archaeon ex4484_2]